MKKVLWIGLVLVIIAAVFIYKEYNRKNVDLATTKEDITISSAELMKLYVENETEADAKYLNKIIAVSGPVNLTYKDENGGVHVTLNTDYRISDIHCEMDSSFNEKALTLKKGTKVTVKGECTGKLDDVVLVRSVLVE